MFSVRQSIRAFASVTTLVTAFGCGSGPDAYEREGAIIDPPTQCSPDRPDCSVSEDYPEAGDLTAENSAGIRFASESGALVVDRVGALPDSDGDGVPDDADDCPGTPDWITCDDDPTNDGVYVPAFYDPDGAPEVVRTGVVTTTVDIPAIDVYFLIDATPTLAEEIAVLQAEILTIIDDVRLLYEDARFGLGLYREYPVPPLAPQYSQSPYHHILDLTADASLIETAVASLNTVANNTAPTAATQALFSVATALGLGDMVANRGACPDVENSNVGYPCFRPDVLHVVLNVTDAAVYNGPQSAGAQYPVFDPGVGGASLALPPVEMFPALFFADGAASALDLGDLSGRSLTLLGMSTLLTDQVNTAVAPGCAPPPPPPPPDDPPGANMDGKDVVLVLRFDASVLGASVFANNTHWPGANVALFTDPSLDPTSAQACDGGTAGLGMWGQIGFAPVASQPYYLVADGIIPAADPGYTPEGAFSISIVHDGDPSNPSWLTADAPVGWDAVEAALLGSDIRVASVVSLRDPAVMPSEGTPDARLMAFATEALTKTGDEWVTELTSANGEGLDSAVSNTLTLPKTQSVYDIEVTSVDDPASSIDERDFVSTIRWKDCAQGEALECGSGSGPQCQRCDVGAVIDFEVLFQNTFVPPTATSQVFDFELLVRADDAVEVERIPVRVLVPNDASHQFGDAPESAFYRNSYDTTLRCTASSDRPKWGDLTWSGTTPGDTTIAFQIRTSPTESELSTATPAIVEIPTDTGTNDTFNIRDELVADGQVWGLPFISITAVLNATNDPPATPTLAGWTFEFVCEPAE